MLSKIILESNDIEFGEIDLIHINKINDKYLCFLKGVKFYSGYDYSFLQKNNKLNVMKMNRDEYLASFYIVDQANFLVEKNNIIIMALPDYWVRRNYVNIYSEILFSWNNDDAYFDWFSLSSEKKKIWLDLSFDCHGLQKKNIENDIIVDCSNITDIPSLYCCLGEAFLGKRSYLGRCLDSLYDCLIDISHSNVKVIFKNSNQMVKALNTDKIRKKYRDDYVSILIDIFKCHRFEIDLI
ncbi:barstar family protein [Xenorhabdus stockiae]|uniref:barstar family protein n=1 Tax=Xenorhabdus stockiae TaxID=351614 RepID=UPI004063F0B8